MNKSNGNSAGLNGGDDGVAHGSLVALMIGAIGIVYGDIGTSPLYAFREAVTAARGGGLDDRESVMGVLSLIVWALVLNVTLKYVLLLLRADNHGEGGTFALMALAQKAAPKSAGVILILGLAGASFFYGDAVITPAISVLSAVEGLKLVSPVFDRWVIPIALLILVALFWFQRYGTTLVAQYFGPLTLLWFLVMALGGLIHIADDPSVLGAVSPHHAVLFLWHEGLVGFTILGLVFLAVTGAEALYADLGHFGRNPIQLAWITVVFPALLLNYFGQGALVLTNPDTIESPFYSLFPEWALIPVLILATVATVIASQAVITGAFSLTRQAVQLGLLPRLAIVHKSATMAGQIYMPGVNWLLLVGVVLVVVLFRTSSNLAAAYGVAVTADMILTSTMAFFVLWKLWRWNVWSAVAVIGPLLLVEQAFFVSNILKVFDGGWLPLLFAAVMFTIMRTWVRGYGLLLKHIRSNETNLTWLSEKLTARPPVRVPGTAIFLSADPNGAPTSLMHNLKHNRVLHERNIILTLKTEKTPRVDRAERVTIDKSDPNFTRVTARYGFMETPNVPKIFEHCRKRELPVDLNGASFFLSRRTLKTTTNSEMPVWQERLFISLARSAEDATAYFRIPTDRVVEIGTQLAI
ncbi:MAG: potassium transporter Kup [Hyphomicrobium sp.]|nr:potassium transporter Kup [Hyphomicrobium sp.]